MDERHSGGWLGYASRFFRVVESHQTKAAVKDCRWIREVVIIELSMMRLQRQRMTKLVEGQRSYEVNPTKNLECPGSIVVFPYSSHRLAESSL